MKKIAFVVVALVMSLAANAQFEQGKGYIGASLSGLDISNQTKEFHLGLNAKLGYMFEDDLMALGEVGYDHWDKAGDNLTLGAGVRYYIVQNGLYLGADIKLIPHWRIAVYGDFFRFSGIKYGIPYSPSWGYDAQAEVSYLPEDVWSMNLKLRSRQKAKKDQWNLRYQFDYDQAGWKLRTEVDANLVRTPTRQLTYGLSLFQDVRYSFSSIPITLQMRVQGFYIPQWDNRLYLYENDVLYAYSINSLYGKGGRMYLNFRWKVIPQLAIYLRVSETIYTNSWVKEKQLPATTHTDIHLLLRATL